MANAQLSSHLGIYIEEDFLDRSFSEMLAAEMRTGGYEEAEVYDEYGKRRVNPMHRQTRKAKVPDHVCDLVKVKLLERIPIIEQRFGVKVTECQNPSFLIYRPGDFFEPHRDDSSKSTAPDEVKQRLVSVVVFLNDERASESGEGFSGGSLALYGLLKDPRCEYIGIPIKARTGLMVAFRSDVFHQVTPVLKGERLSIVSWFV